MNPFDMLRGVFSFGLMLLMVVCAPGMLAVQKAGGLRAHKWLMLRVSAGAWFLIGGGFFLLVSVPWAAKQYNAGISTLTHAGGAPSVLGFLAVQWLVFNAMFVVVPYGLIYKGSIENQASKQGLFAGIVASLRRFWPQKENTGYVALGRFRANGAPVYLGGDRKMHTHIVGSTGVGKTEAIKKLIENDIRADFPVVWIDGKGDTSNAAWFAAQVARHGKEHRARFFLPSKKFGSYNAFRHGNATELTDRLVSSLDWSEQYYKNAAKDFLLGTFRALLSQPREFTLSDVYEATTHAKSLQRLIAESKDPQATAILSSYASNKDKQNVLHGLSAQLSSLVNSSFGEMLLGGTNDIDFREVYEKSMFVYIGMPVTAAEEFFPSVGKMMIADLNALNSAIAGGQLKRFDGLFSLVIDEFSSFVTPQFVKLLSQARSQNFAITIAHQTLSDLAKLSVETQNEIMGNTNIKMALQLDVPSDAELFANVLGTKKALEQTHQTQSGILGEGLSGMGSMKVVEEYIIHPNQIKQLGIGQAAFIRKRPFSYGVIDINQAWQPESKEAANEALTQQLYERKREGAAEAWSLRPQAPLASVETFAQGSQRVREKKQRPALKPNAAKVAPSPVEDEEPARARPSSKATTAPVMMAKKQAHDDDTEW